MRLLFLSLAACVPPAESDPTAVDTGTDTDTDTVTGCNDEPIELTPGFGAYGEPFTPAPATGAVLQLVHGLTGEGFWHIDTGIRATSVHPILEITVKVVDPATGAVISDPDDASNHLFIRLIPEGECAGSSTGLRAHLDDIDPGTEELARDICPLGGEELEITWDVVDVANGRTATTTLRGIVALDTYTYYGGPLSDAEFCASH